MSDDNDDRRLQLAIEHLTVSTQAWITAQTDRLAQQTPIAPEAVNVFGTMNDPGTLVPSDLRECILYARRGGFDSVTFNTSGAAKPDLPRYAAESDLARDHE